MRAHLGEYDLFQPKSLDEALDALASNEGVRPLAGGTDLMVTLEAGSLPPSTLLDLQGIPELSPRLRWTDGLALSALASYADVRRDAEVSARYPMLPRAAREVGALAIQTCGTWAGNVANASPAADGVPALMAYDAEVELSSAAGARRLPLSGLYRGYKALASRPDELITEIRLPPPPAARTEYYRKVGTRRFQAISKTLLAGWIVLDDDRTVRDVRMVLASVAPYTLRALETERVLRGHVLTPELVDDACRAIQEEIHPIDDVRSTERYRRAVTANLVREFLSAPAPPFHRV